MTREENIASREIHKCICSFSIAEVIRHEETKSVRTFNKSNANETIQMLEEKKQILFEQIKLFVRSTEHATFVTLSTSLGHQTNFFKILDENVH